jgi:GDP-4-dehydro-6-deoxy-D-mannose reductase
MSDDLAGRVVLITGASGFVGPHVARALAERGARVHGLGNDRPSARLALESWQTADLSDEAGLEQAVAAVRPDAVIHLAGQSSAGRSFEQPVETFEANAVGTWRLLEAVRRTAPRARVLVAGSGEVYGPQPAGSRVTEAAPFRPVSPYALSKAAADAMAEVASARLGLDVVRVRAFAHTGPGQRPPFVIPSWAQQIAAIEAGPRRCSGWGTSR